MKIYPRALARCQILQAACSFEINDPSGNFFSGPRLTTLERELILNGAAKKGKSHPWVLTLVSLCLGGPWHYLWKTLLRKVCSCSHAIPMRRRFPEAAVGARHRVTEDHLLIRSCHWMVQEELGSGVSWKSVWGCLSQKPVILCRWSLTLGLFLYLCPLTSNSLVGRLHWDANPQQ